MSMMECAVNLMADVVHSSEAPDIYFGKHSTLKVVYL